MLEKGTTLAGYRIDAVLGQGGMGTVYEATQLSLDRVVALKLLATHLTDDVAFRERFRREGQIQAKLEHPHIVTVYEAGESEHGLFIAMRLVRGRTLKDMIVARELDAGRTLRILEPVAEALDEAHQTGLIHRDIKPQNMLVGGRDHAFLADFGLTKGASERSLTKSGYFVGTLDYVSPEQIRGERATPASDVYSLAGVLYECLTGVVPYPKESEAAVLYAHVMDPPPKLSDHRPELPAHLDEVIARAMAKEPAERHQSALDLIDEVGRSFTRRTRAAIRPPGPLEMPEETGIRKAEVDVSTKHAVPVDPPSETVLDQQQVETELSPAPAKAPDQTVAAESAAPKAPAPPPTTPPAAKPPPSETVVDSPVVDATAAGAIPQAAAGSVAGEAAAGAVVGETAAGALPQATAAGAVADEAAADVVPAATAAGVVPEATAAGAVAEATAAGAGAAGEAAGTRSGTGRRGADDRGGGLAVHRGRIAAAVAALVVLVVGGFLLGRALSGGEAEPAQAKPVAVGDLSLTPAASWARSTKPPVAPGIAFDAPLVLASGPKSIAAGMVAATGPTLLPTTLLDRLDAPPPKPAAVKLGGLEAYRYDKLRADGRTLRVYAAPTTNGVATVVCANPTTAAECDQMAATLKLTSGEPLSLGPDAAYAKKLGKTIDTLDAARAKGARELRKASKPGAQAQAATQLASAHGTAAKSLRDATNNPLFAAGNAALVGALRNVESAYRRLAAAARRGDAGAYAAAKRQLGKAEAALGDALDAAAAGSA